MERKNKQEPTTIEIVTIVIEAVVAAAALISAIRWW